MTTSRPTNAYLLPSLYLYKAAAFQNFSKVSSIVMSHRPSSSALTCENFFPSRMSRRINAYLLASVYKYKAAAIQKFSKVSSAVTSHSQTSSALTCENFDILKISRPTSAYLRASFYIYSIESITRIHYEVASISRLLKIIGLFCRISSLL